MKALKIIGIVLLVILIVVETIFTLYFLFGREGYGIDVLTQFGEDGFFGGIKNFFVDLWNGVKFVFKA